MAKFVANRTVAAVGSATQSASVNVSDLETARWWVTGTFVATIQLQISPDGSAWVNSGSPVTAVAALDIPNYARYARIDVTAYTSGSVVNTVTGVDNDLDP